MNNLNKVQWVMCGELNCINVIPVNDSICSECVAEEQWNEHCNTINIAVDKDHEAIRRLEKRIGKGNLSFGEIQDLTNEIEYLNYHIETLIK